MIGSKIRELRKARKISQEELAERISEITGESISRQSLSGWESGAVVPRTSNLQAVTKALNIPLSVLLDEETDNETDSQWNEEIAQRVKAARKKAGISQKALAGLIGVHEMTLIRLEKGQKKINVNELEKISSVLNVPLSEFLDVPPMPSNVSPIAMPTGRIIPVPLLSPEFAACCGDAIPTYSEIQNEPDKIFRYTIAELGGTYDEMRPPYAVRADGACLEKSRIFDGDILIFNPALEPRQGQVCIVCWAGALSTKKVVRAANGSIQLFSDVDAFVIDAKEAADPKRFAIWGPVVQSRRAIR